MSEINKKRTPHPERDVRFKKRWKPPAPDLCRIAEKSDYSNRRRWMTSTATPQILAAPVSKSMQLTMIGS